MHHVLNSPFDLGEGRGLAAVVQHGDHSVHASEHFNQHLVMVGEREAWGGILSKSVVPLIRWLLGAGHTREDIHFNMD